MQALLNRLQTLVWRFVPWRWFIRNAARSHGFMDPAEIAARVRGFGQPSEYDLPLEIVRANVIFQARGLMNNRAIQHNLDWIWPFWIERQFNPLDPSFLPRAFSFSHVNLTHRNWTAVGLPDIDLYPLVDPRGLVTPLHDGWSLDLWLRHPDGRWLIPSRCAQARQRLLLDPAYKVETEVEAHGMVLRQQVWMHQERGAAPKLHTALEVQAPDGAVLYVALRPYNPEGVQFIDSVEGLAQNKGWRVNNAESILWNRGAERQWFSNYRQGDVFHRLDQEAAESSIRDHVGMATAAAAFPVDASQRSLAIEVSLEREMRSQSIYQPTVPSRSWREIREPLAALDGAPEAMQAAAPWYEAARSTLLHLSAGEIFPGPYTYRRFWYRDAVLMAHALLKIGEVRRVEKALSLFFEQQRSSGYFQSQQGEWDSNGQVLWLCGQYDALAARALPAGWKEAVWAGACWLDKKRVAKDAEGTAHERLLPAGFSAEHFGPNDYYYWDDFWAVSGLRAASHLFRKEGELERAEACDRWAEEFLAACEESLQRSPSRHAPEALPASPYRRLDAGAIGSLVADYPLHLYDAGEARLGKTADFLRKHCCVQGGFFQDMTHSGINIYLTLDLAQYYLRAGSGHWQALWQSVNTLASPTGNWPEAIHPQTFGGCVGDGQHGWAAAEYVLFVRSLFLREEGDVLVLGPGLAEDWRALGPLSFGPSPTSWGPVTLRWDPADGGALTLDGQWRREAPALRVALPGTEARALPALHEPSRTIALNHA